MDDAGFARAQAAYERAEPPERREFPDEDEDMPVEPDPDEWRDRMIDRALEDGLDPKAYLHYRGW